MAGTGALEAGDWSAVDQGETAEALYGLADALWWLGENHESIGYRERAYAEFRRRPDPAQAALMALHLCVHYRANIGNPVAAAGWLARATRLVEEFELDALRGWLLLIKAYDCGDGPVGERWAREAHEFARRSEDLDLELCALSQIGASLVMQGRVAEGVAWLDEAMAASLGGEGGSLDTVVFTSCNMIISCSHCAEFERAAQWVHAADRFAERYGCPFLYAECRTSYGGVLVATGDWSHAEDELRAALELSRASLPALHGRALTTLAELRLAQGRIEEAERLLAGLEDHDASAPVTASIHLLRGKPALAATRIHSRLHALGRDRLESALLLELLGEAEIAQGEEEVAAERGRELVELGETLGCRIIGARGERLRGHALATRADVSSSRRHLDAAVSLFIRLEMPLELARTRRLLAETLREVEPEVAVLEARAALTVFEELGAGRDADATAALLRRLGVKAARAGPKGVGTLTKREREVFVLLGEGLSNPEIAGRLHLSRKTVEHHVARVLAKLGLRSRAEAAAEAVRQPGQRSAAK